MQKFRSVVDNQDMHLKGLQEIDLIARVQTRNQISKEKKILIRLIDSNFWSRVIRNKNKILPFIFKKSAQLFLRPRNKKKQNIMDKKHIK